MKAEECKMKIITEKENKDVESSSCGGVGMGGLWWRLQRTGKGGGGVGWVVGDKLSARYQELQTENLRIGNFFYCSQIIGGDTRK